MTDHHQVLGLVTFVANAAGKFERPGITRDCFHGLGVRKVRFAAAVIGLHRDKIGETRALAYFDRLLVESDRLVVLPGAPRDSPEMIEGVGRMALVVHRAGLRQRFGEARRRLFILICTPIGHAQLDQRVTRLFTFATGAQHVNDAAHIGNGALRLSGLCARRAPLLV